MTTEVYSNDAATSLVNAIVYSDTVLTVASSQEFNTTGQFRIRIDNEIMLVTSVSGNNWTVTRAAEVCEGVQVAVAHGKYAAVYGVVTAASLLALTIIAGAGTVGSVSVVSANGVSGTVASATTTPAITLVLGAITPSSVAATGTVGGSNLTGTNTGDQTITLTGDVTGSGPGSFAATIGANKVTYGKMQQASASTLLGNPTGSAANIAEITLGTNLSFDGTVLNATAGGTGTVTSVQVSGGTTGLIASGGPITVSGTITISGTLIAANGGLGNDTSVYTLGQIPVAQGAGAYLPDSRRGLYVGTGPPSSGTGYPGDYYIDNSVVPNLLYQKS